MTSTIAPEERNDTETHNVIRRAATAVADVGAQVQTAAVGATAVVADNAPEALAASRGSVERVLTGLGRRSDGSLALGTVFAAGLSGGMLVSRAPRLFVALAFLATALFGGTLLGRGGTWREGPAR